MVLARFTSTSRRRALVSATQSVILVLLALALGADHPGGALGVVILIVSAALPSIAFGSLSNALALLVRREETLIATVNFTLLPLTFLSSAFLQLSLAPGWIQTDSGGGSSRGRRAWGAPLRMRSLLG